MSTQHPDNDMVPDVSVSNHQHDRRRFLTRLGIIAGGVFVVGSQVWIILKLWLGPDRARRLTGPVTLGAVEQFGEGSVTHVWKHHLLLVRHGTELFALSDVCTHNKCHVDVIPEQRIILCPCHGSQFSLTGQVLRGPASVPLRRFPVIVQQGDVIVDTSRRVPPRNSY